MSDNAHRAQRALDQAAARLKEAEIAGPIHNPLPMNPSSTVYPLHNPNVIRIDRAGWQGERHD